MREFFALVQRNDPHAERPIAAAIDKGQPTPEDAVASMFVWMGERPQLSGMCLSHNKYGPVYHISMPMPDHTIADLLLYVVED